MKLYFTGNDFPTLTVEVSTVSDIQNIHGVVFVTLALQADGSTGGSPEGGGVIITGGVGVVPVLVAGGVIVI